MQEAAELPPFSQHHRVLTQLWPFAAHDMTITPVDGVFKMARKNDYDVQDPTRPKVALPGKPWIALRVTRV